MVDKSFVLSHYYNFYISYFKKCFVVLLYFSLSGLTSLFSQPFDFEKCVEQERLKALQGEPDLEYTAITYFAIDVCQIKKQEFEDSQPNEEQEPEDSQPNEEQEPEGFQPNEEQEPEDSQPNKEQELEGFQLNKEQEFEGLQPNKEQEFEGLQPNKEQELEDSQPNEEQEPEDSQPKKTFLENLDEGRLSIEIIPFYPGSGKVYLSGSVSDPSSESAINDALGIKIKYRLPEYSISVGYGRYNFQFSDKDFPYTHYFIDIISVEWFAAKGFFAGLGIGTGTVKNENTDFQKSASTVVVDFGYSIKNVHKNIDIKIGYFGSSIVVEKNYENEVDLNVGVYSLYTSFNFNF